MMTHQYRQFPPMKKLGNEQNTKDAVSSASGTNGANPGLRAPAGNAAFPHGFQHLTGPKRVPSRGPRTGVKAPSPSIHHMHREALQSFADRRHAALQIPLGAAGGEQSIGRQVAPGR